MDRVDNLEYLVELRQEPSLTLSNQQAGTIVSLWQNLLPYDQQRVGFAAQFQDRLNQGQFRSPKKREQWPDCCRVVETMFVRLCQVHKSPKKGKSRWDLIVEDYERIRQLVLSNGAVMDSTTLKLVHVNTRTTQQWYSKWLKRQDERVLLQGIALPPPHPVAVGPLPSAT